MPIRHWHPIQLGIIWLIDLALFVVLRLYAHPARRDEQALAIIVWLFFSIPVFVITWKWASGRESNGSSKTVGESPVKAVDKETQPLQTPTEKQYRVCTIKLPRLLIEKGFEFPPHIPDRYILPEETRHGETIQEMGWEAEGWNLLSMVPFENECTAEQVTLLALMERPYSLELEEFHSRKYPYSTQ